MKNEKLDTLASCNWVEDSFIHKFLGVAFSLIVIMLQTNFLLWGVLFGLLLFDIVVVVVSYYVVNNLGTFNSTSKQYPKCK